MIKNRTSMKFSLRKICSQFAYQLAAAMSLPNRTTHDKTEAHKLKREQTV